MGTFNIHVQARLAIAHFREIILTLFIKSGFQIRCAFATINFHSFKAQTPQFQNTHVSVDVGLLLLPS